MSIFSPRTGDSRTVPFRRRARFALPAAAVALVALLAAACGVDDTPESTATPAPATPSTAAASATARPAEGATTTPTTPASATTTASTRTTGNAKVDAVLAAIEARDAAKLASLARTIDAACSTAQGAGGPPQCPTGTATGTRVTRFPFASCEGEYLDPAGIQQLFGTRLTSLNPRVYAVATTKEPGTALAPQGDFIVVVETTGATDGAGGRVLHVDSEGRIVNFWTGCGGSAAQLFEARKGATVLLQPARAN